MGHGPGHGRHKKKSILRKLGQTSLNKLIPNTYSRRMTRYSAYDADAVTVRGDVIVDRRKELIQQMEDKESLFLESLLTKIHDIASKFVLVNTEHEDFPIVYVSDEFLSYWKYSRKQIFLKDGRLPMLVGESTRADFVSNLEKTMKEEVGHHYKEYTLYKEGHKKTVSSMVSVLTLPKHSKARYVLVTTDEMDSAEHFGVDVTTKKKNVTEILSGLFNCGIDEGKEMIMNDNFVPKAIQMATTIREEFEKDNKQFFLIIHDNAPKLFWDWLVLYSVIWAIFNIPFELSFRIPCTSPMNTTMADCSDMNKGSAKGSLFEQEWILSLVCELLFIFDVLFSCITTFINDDGVVISDIKHIFQTYLKSWFLIDFMAAIPWELFIRIGGLQDDSFLYFLKAIALLRVFRIVRNSSYYMSSGFSSLIFMMAIFVVFAHFIACGWFAIGKNNLIHKDGWLYKFVENSQDPANVGSYDKTLPFDRYAVGKYNYDSGLSIPKVYLTCLYFSFTSLSTVGFGNAAPQLHFERVYSICLMVVGALMYATIFGYVASIIHRISQQTSELNERQTELIDFIHVHKFPESLASRMEDFFYNHWYTTKGVVASEIMESWPKGLREDCFLYIHDLLLKQWPVLKEASIGCQRALSERLQRFTLCPGDMIYHSGDCVGEIYFVIRGHIKVIKNDKLIGVLTSGDVFGESFWPTRTGRKSKANVQALTYCEFEVLSHESLNEIMILFPDYWDIWAEKLKISYELSSKTALFTEDTPDDLVRYVENQRTLAPDSIVEEIQNKVTDPKQYYYDLSKKRAQTGDGNSGIKFDSNTKLILQQANELLKAAESKFEK
ncbi:potassium voltage-gated channel subfamily H member 1-like [Bolinopsis microptera]|uniref:potassium voltage-gated channel subfamily H member 1-like n=1 Tax=Bolinopsis microptera TaxID=2820187 RepID=UPI00307AB4CC